MIHEDECPSAGGVVTFVINAAYLNWIIWIINYCPLIWSNHVRSVSHKQKSLSRPSFPIEAIHDFHSGWRRIENDDNDDMYGQPLKLRA